MASGSVTVTLPGPSRSHATETHAEARATCPTLVRCSADHNSMRGSDRRAMCDERKVHNVMVLLPLGPPLQPNLTTPNPPEPTQSLRRKGSCIASAPAAIAAAAPRSLLHAVPVARLGCSKPLELASVLYSFSRRARARPRRFA